MKYGYFKIEYFTVDSAMFARPAALGKGNILSFPWKDVKEFESLNLSVEKRKL